MDSRSDGDWLLGWNGWMTRSLLIYFSCHKLFSYLVRSNVKDGCLEEAARRHWVRKRGSADQAARTLGLDGSKMADGLRCAELKGAGIGSEVLGWLGYTVR